MAGAESYGIDYPVALDNNLSTWTNYRNRYWPAHYLIDADGVVRHIKFGEGGYADTEKLIRELLEDANPGVQLPPATEVADDTPEQASTTVETYLGATKEVNYAGDGYTTETKDFTVPASQPADTFALDGSWTIGTQSITPDGDSAKVVLNYHAGDEVRMVLSGSGTVIVDDGSSKKTIKVEGTPNSYQLIDLDGATSGTLTVTVSGGVEAYSFTFG
jgi:hypothetical protein